ncbi:hypothetical protein ABT160_29940 [Streptomyces sp. NPDC001941]|uniref:hypothetical protein n=1 Tax=Streptomyces sp. NPDC001941 TaxID=3154659 RepID=UPI0033188B85
MIKGVVMLDLADLMRPRSQRWVAARAGVGTQTLSNLHRIGLMPAADEMRAVDAVLALCARSLGANRSTNRKAKAGARTQEALARDHQAMSLARELLEDGPVEMRTTLVVDGSRVEVQHALEAVADWLHQEGDDAEPLVLLPLGRWAGAMLKVVAREGGARVEDLPALAC